MVLEDLFDGLDDVLLAAAEGCLERGPLQLREHLRVEWNNEICLRFFELNAFRIKYSNEIRLGF